MSFPTLPEGQWISTRYPYRSPIPSARPRVLPPQFVGRRPRGSCNVRYLDAKTCNSDPTCSWVETKFGESYCRTRPPRVSREYARIAPQVRYQPRFQTGYTSCAHLSKQECEAKGCLWIQTVHGSEYCRGSAGQALPYSSAHPLSHEMDSWLFTEGTNRFNPGRWNRLPEPVKNQIFSETGNQVFRDRARTLCEAIPDLERRQACEDRITHMFQKYCRCLFEQPSAEVFRHGEITGNPYAICNASVSRSHSDIERLSRGLISAAQLRSEESKLARARLCSKTLDVDKIPTPFLYGFAVNRLQTKAGQAAFEGQIPELQDFLQNRDRYRPQLVQLIKRYLASR